MNSRCSVCGRALCNCGKPYPARACSKHGATMFIRSVASVTNSGTRWFEVAACNVPGCPTVRSIKGFDRPSNRKTNVTREPLIKRLGKKFGAVIVAEFYNDEEQTRGPRSSSRLESRPKIQSRSTKGRK